MGTITDGKYKLCVQITNYVSESRLSVKGQAIKVRGIMKINGNFTSNFFIYDNDFFYLKLFISLGGASMLKVLNMDGVEFLDEEMMSLSNLKRAITSVASMKRQRTNDDLSPDQN